MKKLFFILSVFTVSLYAQLSPDNFNFGVNSRLYKINDENPKSNTILDIVIVRDTIWLATTRGLSRSTDNGVSWKNYYQSQPFGEESIPAIGYRAGVIWAATAHSEEKDGNDFPVGTGLKYSKDNGETWTGVPQPLDALGDTVVIYGVSSIRALPITTAFNNITYDISFTDDAVWIASFAGGVRKSTDMGETWQRVVIPPDYLDYIHPDSAYSFSLQPVAGSFGNESNLNHRVFSLAGMGGNSMAVGTANGINITEDGQIWHKYNHQNQKDGISGNFVVALGYNEFDNSLYGATWQAEDLDEFPAVSRTSDLGNTWTVSLAGKKTHNFGFTPNSVIAAADENAFRSLDGGVSWTAPNSIYDNLSSQSLNIEKTNFYSAGSKLNSNLQTDIYLGTTEGLTRLTEETPPWRGEWKIFLASGSVGTGGIETFAFPNPFSPNQEEVRIKYRIPSDGSVSIRIFDFGMNLVKTLIQNAERHSGTDLFESWDGYDEFGSKAPNGVYFYRIDSGNSNPMFGKIMVLN